MKPIEAADLEADRLQEVAEEYRAKGYEVILEPPRDQLPEPLARYRPDLLARKDDETVLVEVRSRASLGQEPLLHDLAKAVREQPG